MRALPALLAGSCLVASCQPAVHEVVLTFYDDENGPHGFVCTEAGSSDLLAGRVVKAQELSVVVDLFRFDGLPACSAVALLEWCQAHGCPLLLDRRKCLRVPLGFLDAGHGMPLDIVRAAIAALKGMVVTPDAPPSVVVVRVVATTATCDEVAAGGASFACSELVGCANSCAVALADAGGEVQLDLDIRAVQCDVATVGICAAPDLAEVQSPCGKL